MRIKEKKEIKIRNDWKNLHDKTYMCPTCEEKIYCNKDTDLVEHFIFCGRCGRKLIFFN